MRPHTRLPSPAVLIAVALLWAGPLAGPLAGQQREAAGAAGRVQVVLSTMHRLNEMEIEMGRLARQRGARDAIKDYGDRLVRDHEFADEKVRDLARSSGVELLPIAALPAAGALRDLHERGELVSNQLGLTFDRMFLDLMATSHSTALGLLDEARARLPAGDVKDLVGRLAPILSQHLELARDLLADAGSGRPATPPVDVEPPPAGGRR